jgi:hypothetical protein
MLHCSVARRSLLFQFTVALVTHSLKLEYMRPLRKALVDQNLTVARIVHLAVVENTHDEGFSFQAPTGQKGRNTRASDASTHPPSKSRWTSPMG